MSMLKHTFSPLPNFPDDNNRIADIPVKGYINQINLILEPVAAGHGFTVLPESVVKAFRDQEAIQTLPLPNPVYETINLVQKKYRPLPARYGFLGRVIENILGEGKQLAESFQPAEDRTAGVT